MCYSPVLKTTLLGVFFTGALLTIFMVVHGCILLVFDYPLSTQAMIALLLYAQFITSHYALLVRAIYVLHGLHLID